MGLTQDFTGLVEPRDPAWLRADPTTRRRYYDAAGKAVLDELAKQLGKGIGRDGRAMRVRKQAVLADGADGPVMEPHYEASRVVTLADYSATDHSLKLWWHAGTGHRQHRRARAKGGKAVPFGEILQYHADGEVPRAPVRDVRLCKARIANVVRRLAAVWEGLKARATFAPLATAPVEARRPRAVPTPRPAPRPPAEIRVRGVGFVRDHAALGRGHKVVMVRTDLLEGQFRKDTGYYIGPGGKGPSARAGSYSDALRTIADALYDGGPIQMPRLFMDIHGNVAIEDGRHRFAALRDLGFTHFPVSAPAEDAARIGRKVGSHTLSRRRLTPAAAIAAALAAAAGTALALLGSILGFFREQ